MSTNAHMSAHQAALAQQAATLEVARQQLAAAKARAESAEAAARLNTQLHANAQQQLATDRAMRAAAMGAPTPAPAASPVVSLPPKTTAGPLALSVSSSPFPVDRSLPGREAAAERQAAEGPGFLEQLGAGLSQGLGGFLSNLRVDLGGGGAQPVTITTGGGGGGGGQDWTPIVLVGAAVVAALVLLGGD